MQMAGRKSSDLKPSQMHIQKNGGQMKLKFNIQKGSLMPANRNKISPLKMVLSKMGIGDRVCFPAKYYARIVPMIYHYGKVLGVRVSVNRVSDNTYSFTRRVAELI